MNKSVASILLMSILALSTFNHQQAISKDENINSNVKVNVSDLNIDDLIARFVDFETVERNTSLLLGGGLTSDLANNALLATAAAEGWPGNGTIDDPIIVSGYRFVNLSASVALQIYRTTLYVIFENNIFDIANSINVVWMFKSQYASNIAIIHNLFIDQGSGITNSISITDGPSQNVTIVDNLFISNSAIALDRISGFTISNNTIIGSKAVSITNLDQATGTLPNYIEDNIIYSNSSGITISSTTSIDSPNQINQNTVYSDLNSLAITNIDGGSITNNFFNSSLNYGIVLVNSFGYDILLNKIWGRGVSFPSVDTRNQLQSNVNDNTINGRPLHYIVDAHSTTVLRDPAQVFIFFSSNIVIEGTNFGIMSSITIANSNYITISSLYFEDMSIAIAGSNVSNIEISGNTFRNIWLDGISLESASSVHISQNNFFNVANDAIDFFNVNLSVVEENTAYNTGYNFVDVYLANNLEIARNYVVTNENDDSIEITEASNVAVIGNYIFDNIDDSAIGGYGVNNMVVYGNYIRYVGYAGIEVGLSNQVEIEENNIGGFSYAGMYFYLSSDMLVIRNNIDGGYAGISTFNTDNQTFIENFINDTYVGLDLSHQVNETSFIQSNIINNTFTTSIRTSYGNISLINNDIFTPSSGNIISSTNSEINASGNYWSNWTIPDTNNDGIVDEPFNQSGVVDLLASTKPNVISEFSELQISAEGVSYIEGNVGNAILWNIYGFPYINYTIEMNGEVYDSGISPSQFETNVDGLTVGTYNFTLIVTGLYIDYIAFSIEVVVLPKPIVSSSVVTSSDTGSVTTSSTTSSTTTSSTTTSLTTPISSDTTTKNSGDNWAIFFSTLLFGAVTILKKKRLNR